MASETKASGPYAVHLSLTDPIDGQERDGELVEAHTLRDASRIMREYVNGKNPMAEPIGNSQIGRNCGRVTQVLTGKEVARVSYNGRVWEPGKWPTAEITELDR